MELPSGCALPEDHISSSSSSSSSFGVRVCVFEFVYARMCHRKSDGSKNPHSLKGPLVRCKPTVPAFAISEAHLLLPLILSTSVPAPPVLAPLGLFKLRSERHICCLFLACSLHFLQLLQKLFQDFSSFIH